MSSAATFRPPPRRLAAISLGAFLLLGLLYPILGPALPKLSAQFGLSATGASLLISVNFAGAVLGVIVGGLLAARLAAHTRSALGVLLMGLGCLGLAFAPSFPLALLAALLLGGGVGVLDLTLNVWLSTSYGERSAAVLNVLSASFGVGAVLTPLAVGLAGGDVARPLLACALLAALLVPLLMLTPHSPQDAPAPLPETHVTTRRGRLILGTFVLLFLTYVATEGGVGAWEVTHLQGSLGLDTGAAARLSSLFWVSFTLGRLLAAPLALRFAPAPLLTLALGLSALCLALAALPGLAPVAYTLCGLTLAPVFNSSLVWLTRAVPGGAAPTLVFAGAFLGPTLFSPVVGFSRDHFGLSAIPVTLTVIALLALAVVLALRQMLGTHANQGNAVG